LHCGASVLQVYHSRQLERIFCIRKINFNLWVSVSLIMAS
jgi:hypothetical protein